MQRTNLPITVSHDSFSIKLPACYQFQRINSMNTKYLSIILRSALELFLFSKSPRLFRRSFSPLPVSLHPRKFNKSLDWIFSSIRNFNAFPVYRHLSSLSSHVATSVCLSVKLPFCAIRSCSYLSGIITHFYLLRD